jgi:hypothetical protein
VGWRLISFAVVAEFNGDRQWKAFHIEGAFAYRAIALTDFFNGFAEPVRREML